MRYNLKSLLYSLLAVGLFSAMGCSKSTDLGLSLVEQEQSTILSTDTSTLIMTTLEAIRTPTQARSQMICGAYDDPEWGSSSASIYMNFRLNSTNATFPNAVFDSLVLVMAYETTNHYGELNENKPTTTVQSWDVLRVSEDIVDGTTYYSDKTFTTSDVLKGGFQFQPNDTLRRKIGNDSIPYLSIRLDDAAGVALGQTFLNPQGGAVDIYNSNTDFKNWFKGLHIRPTAGAANNSIVSFKSRNNNTKLVVYYTDTTGGGSEQKTFEFLTNEDAEVFSGFEHTHPAALTDNLVTDTVTYIQGLDGLHTKVELPYVHNVGNVIINKAEIVFTVADTGTTAYPVPPLIVAKRKDTNGDLIVIDDVLTSLTRTPDYRFFGGSYEQNTATNTYVYRMHIAEEMQSIIDGTRSERAIYLTTPSALHPDRVKLVNHQGFSKPILYLTYTKLD